MCVLQFSPSPNYSELSSFALSAQNVENDFLRLLHSFVSNLHDNIFAEELQQVELSPWPRGRSWPLPDQVVHPEVQPVLHEVWQLAPEPSNELVHPRCSDLLPADPTVHDAFSQDTFQIKKLMA